MVAYWTNFAATGDPNGPDADGTPLPEWTRYAPFGGDAMRLGQRTRHDGRTPSGGFRSENE